MLSKIRLSKGLLSSPLIQIHICIIVCGATTGSHFTQNLLLNAQQCRYVRLCNKLYILKLVLTKSYKEILVFFLKSNISIKDLAKTSSSLGFVFSRSDIQKGVSKIKITHYLTG